MKKIISLLLILLLCACSTKEVTPDPVVEVKDDSYYLAKLENYEPRAKNKTNTIDNEEFSKLLDEAFIDYLEADYITTRDFLKDYEAYGIKKPEVKWPAYNYKDTSKISYYEQQLAKLAAIDFSSLSYTQQFDYEKYEYELYESILNEFYKQYKKPFSTGEDILGYIYINLSEFKLSTKEYLEDYFVLLADTPAFIDEVLAFTAKQAEDNIYLDNDSIDYSFEYAYELMGSEEIESGLIQTFDSRIEELDFLTVEEKETYKQKNAEYVKGALTQALEKIGQEITVYYDKVADEDLPICKTSQNYARFIFMYNTSSNKDTDTLFNECLNELNAISEKFIMASSEDSVTWKEYNDQFYSAYAYDEFNLTDEETLKYLEEKVKTFVPEIGDLTYTISPLEVVKEGSTVNAYFLQPPVDDLANCIMRTNPFKISDDNVKNFVILAHEGLPGHMYQFQYYIATNPQLINLSYRLNGYYEGWAQYSEINALNFTSIQNEGTKDIYEFSLMRLYYLFTLGDIYFNQYGKSIDEFAQFLLDNGYNEEYAEYIYYIVVADSGTDAQYAIGYLEFRNLQQKAKEALGAKFDIVEFNKELLVHGPLPLVILEKAVDDYINENK